MYHLPASTIGHPEDAVVRKLRIEYPRADMQDSMAIYPGPFLPLLRANTVLRLSDSSVDANAQSIAPFRLVLCRAKPDLVST